jgi:hypothetical protein
VLGWVGLGRVGLCWVGPGPVGNAQRWRREAEAEMEERGGG